MIRSLLVALAGVGLATSALAAEYPIGQPQDLNGLEVAGSYRILDALSLRANYTWTDSEQLSGADKGMPLMQSARHMANATPDWTVSDRFSVQLIGEARSKRYRGSRDAKGNPNHYRDYEVLHLGAQYRFSDAVSLSARINNLLDQDFTSFTTVFTRNPTTGAYTATYLDDYKNKDKARNLWLSLNIRF